MKYVLCDQFASAQKCVYVRERRSEEISGEVRFWWLRLAAFILRGLNPSFCCTATSPVAVSKSRQSNTPEGDNSWNHVSLTSLFSLPYIDFVVASPRI
jgi:hypothetical protein